MTNPNDIWVQEGRRIKAWFVMRRDLPMTQPKFGVQIGHGTDLIHMAALNDLVPRDTGEREAASPYYFGWINATIGNRRKIVLGGKTLAEIEKLKTECETAGMKCDWIVDAGLTEFGQETTTGMVIHPWDDTAIPKSLKRAQLWKPLDDVA